jgi:Kazal-type serine protease inhibitor domain
MIQNFYNIPYIPCSDRLAIDNPQGEQTFEDKKLRCSGLNPDNIFGTLFPDRADPTLNYDVTNNTKITVGTKDGVESEKDAKQCAQECSSRPTTCNYFTIEKGANECRLYTTKEASKNDKFNELALSNNLQSWRKNDLLDGTKNCNIEDGFILQDIGYFPSVNNANDNIKPTNIQKGLTKNECLSSCLYNDSCNSVVFLESKTKCQKMTSTRSAASTALSNTAYKNENASTYLKKEGRDFLTNRFGVKDDMLDYYKSYAPSGKVGDSFCEFIKDENKCMTSYVVGPNNQKEVPDKNSKSVTKVPTPKLCLPPNCVPKLPETGLRGKLKVDSSFNIMCPAGNGQDAKDCVKAIDKTPFATFDRMGLPTDNDASNPPNGYLPYTMEYDTYNNLEIPSSGVTASGEVCAAKPINDGEKPSIGAMEFPEDCEKWCNKSVDCGGYSYYIGDDGKAKCNYYQNVGMKGLKDALNPKKDTHTMIKRGNRYVQKPLQSEIKKPYFNNSSAADTGVSREKVCIQEGFTTQDQYCPFPYNKTNDINKIKKDDNSGSNCPTPLVNCRETRYGCCNNDNETAKIDSGGSNCPTLTRAPCLTSKYGCCPGTIIPMKYLCTEEEQDICAMTNCELNDNERGDVYAFYGGNGKSCKNNSTCPSGQMCVDGLCKNYNEKYYNGLNSVKMPAMHTQSGNSMNDLLCGCPIQQRNTGCKDVYEPVCGVDGKTYRSQCVAKNLGIKVEHYGTCGDILEKFYSLDDFKMPIKKSNISYWILSLLLVLLVGSILYCFR